MLDSMREWGLFLLKRFAIFLIALFGVSVITFVVTHKIGNPVYLLVGTRYNQEMLDNIVREIGLDRPLHEQYLRYASNLLQGNLGTSRFSYNPVLQDIRNRLPATLELSTWALAMGVLWAVPAGVLAAMRPRGLLARFADLMARTGVSMPGFWLGLLLIFVFFAELHWFPAPLGRIARSIGAPEYVTGWFTIDTLAGRRPRGLPLQRQPPDSAGADPGHHHQPQHPADHAQAHAGSAAERLHSQRAGLRPAGRRGLSLRPAQHPGPGRHHDRHDLRLPVERHGAGRSGLHLARPGALRRGRHESLRLRTDHGRGAAEFGFLPAGLPRQRHFQRALSIRACGRNRERPGRRAGDSRASVAAATHDAHQWRAAGAAESRPAGAHCPAGSAGAAVAAA